MHIELTDSEAAELRAALNERRRELLYATRGAASPGRPLPPESVRNQAKVSLDVIGGLAVRLDPNQPPSRAITLAEIEQIMELYPDAGDVLDEILDRLRSDESHPSTFGCQHVLDYVEGVVLRFCGRTDTTSPILGAWFCSDHQPR